MNRIFFVTVSTFILQSYISCAQIIDNIGIKGGVTQSNFIWEYRLNQHYENVVLEDENELGYDFYFYSNLIDKDNWTVGASIGFIEKASNHIEYWSGHYIGGISKYKTKINYISIIPFLTGKFPGLSSFKIGGSIGPRLDILVNKSNNLDFFIDEFFIYEIENKFKKVVVGLQLSIEAAKYFKKSTLGIEFSYLPNLTYLIKEEGGNNDGYQDETSYIKMSDRTYLLNVFYLVRLNSI